jgi:RNA polymerase I-specific transcription-initiation factor
LKELVPSVYVDDVEGASDQLSAWAAHIERAIGASALAQVHGMPPGSLFETHSQMTGRFVESVSDKVADRLKVGTERLSRSVALDAILSTVVVQPHCGITRGERTRDLSEPEDGSEENKTAHSAVNAAISRLGGYTAIQSKLSTIDSNAVSDMFAHLPDDIGHNPGDYSYAEVELSIAHARNKARAERLDPAAKRRAERVEAARRKRNDKAQTSEKPSLSQETPVNVPSSSQDGGQRAMTQPERGEFGVRPAKRFKPKKKATQGF